MRLPSQITLALTLILSGLQPVFSATCSAKSGLHTVPLLELYTSEGCSSCPPADKWMSDIKHGVDKITPLAFHVDYWDYIGWKDAYSEPQYSERQRKIAAYAGSTVIYTPQFVMNGHDFRGWNHLRLKKAIEKNQKIASRAHLNLNASILANGEITLEVTANVVNPADVKHADIFVAIYENKLVSQINAGENNGRELKHDYVVRHLFGAYSVNHQNQFSKNFNLDAEWHARDAGAVIFVQNSQTGEILQSLALPFCNA